MNGIDKLASELQKTISEKDKKKKTGYYSQSEVVRVTEDTVWVKIPGGIDETPVSKTTSAKVGDKVQVRVEGGRAWIAGNYTAPPTDDTRANSAYSLAETADYNAERALRAADSAERDAERANTAASAAERAATEAKQDASAAERAATEAKQDASAAHTAANEAKQDASAANTAANEAKQDASAARTAANEAKQDAVAASTAANAASIAATEAKQDASAAHTAANNALTGLSTVESVVDTLSWLTEHSTLTTDTTPVVNKNYYIRNQDGTFTRVSNTEGKNPAEEGWYEMDEAVSNYVASHLALTDYGLNLTLDNTSYRVHIGTYTATGDDGVYIIDGEGNIVSYFGENIRFNDNKAQYIGNENAYIVFNPADGGSITIGGSNVNIGGNKTLSDLIAEINNTFIFDVTYTVSGTDPNRVAHFEAHLYRGGVDIKDQYSPDQFTWYLKSEDGETPIIPSGSDSNTGYTIDVDISDCGYGAEVISHFTTTEDSPILNSNDDNLTDVNNRSLTGRTESGESVRVRDLTTSTTLYSTDKVMIVGSEDEHLVSMQTLQDYLNTNLNKQILFNTTAAWNAQVQLQSQANTLYIYTDHQVDSDGNVIAGIKVGDGNAYLIDMPFTDSAIMEHISDNVRHISAEERAFWNNKVSCYLADNDRIIFTTA